MKYISMCVWTFFSETCVRLFVWAPMCVCLDLRWSCIPYTHYTGGWSVSMYAGSGWRKTHKTDAQTWHFSARYLTYVCINTHMRTWRWRLYLFTCLCLFARSLSTRTRLMFGTYIVTHAYACSLIPCAWIVSTRKHITYIHTNKYAYMLTSCAPIRVTYSQIHARIHLPRT